MWHNPPWRLLLILCYSHTHFLVPSVIKKKLVFSNITTDLFTSFFIILNALHFYYTTITTVRTGLFNTTNQNYCIYCEEKFTKRKKPKSKMPPKKKKKKKKPKKQEIDLLELEKKSQSQPSSSEIVNVPPVISSTVI